MDLIAAVFGLIVGLLVGLIGAWVVLRARAEATTARSEADQAKAAAAIESQLAAARADVATARSAEANARAGVESVRADAHRRVAEADAATAVARAEAAEISNQKVELSAQVAAAQAQRDAMQRERDAARQQIAEVVADRDAMSVQFKELSRELLDQQSARAEATAEQRLQATEQLIKPMAEKLAKFDERLNQTEKDRVQMTTDLRAQVQQVQSIGRELRLETSALSSALSKPQVRGQWGELHLQRAVELAGMVEHCDFDLQVSTGTADGTRRPDMVVRLSEDKFIYVDAKTTIAALIEAHDVANPAQRAAALTRFGRHVKTQIDQLGNKKYWTLKTASPEFVVMFLPTEACLQIALEEVPNLLEYATDRNVVIATPMTLIALLRAVAFGWRQAALAETAAEVFNLGRELYDRLAIMGEHFDRLGKQLTSAVTSYNKTVSSLEKRVFVSARKLRDLHVTEKELPSVIARSNLPQTITAPELVENAAGERALPEVRALPSGGPRDHRSG